MKTINRTLELETAEELDIVDITPRVEGCLSESRLKKGVANIFITGSTAAVTTMEYEPGLIADMKAAMERLFPRNIAYRHGENGRSHIRASFLGPSLTIPFADGKLQLGTWQQIVLVELDTGARKRRLVVTFSGE